MVELLFIIISLFTLTSHARAEVPPDLFLLEPKERIYTAPQIHHPFSITEVEFRNYVEYIFNQTTTQQHKHPPVTFLSFTPVDYKQFEIDWTDRTLAKLGNFPAMRATISLFERLLAKSLARLFKNIDIAVQTDDYVSHAVTFAYKNTTYHCSLFVLRFTNSYQFMDMEIKGCHPNLPKELRRPAREGLIFNHYNRRYRDRIQYTFGVYNYPLSDLYRYPIATSNR